MAATLTVTAVATSLVAAGPASAAAPASCPNHHVCLYEHINFNRDNSGWKLPIHVDQFRDCNGWIIDDGWVTSVYNNTDAHIQLWDLSSNPVYLVGTAVRRKGYTYLGARGNDATDFVIGYGCIGH
jgi:hypothetical protein